MRGRPWPAIAIGAAVLVGIALRVAYVLSLRETPWFATLNVDPGYYDRWASEIAGGRWIAERPFYMDPLYPYVLGTLYAAWGRDFLLPRLVNVALSAGTCLVLAAQARRLAGPWGAAVAAGAFALYAPDVFHVGEIDKTTLSLFLVALTLLLLTRATRRALLGAGVALGLAALTRATLLAFAPVGLALVVFDPPPGRDGAGRAGRIGAFAIGVLLALSPVTLHNWWVSGQPVLTTANAGQNFYIGNCPENPQGAYASLPFVRGAPPFEELDFHAEAERRAGRALTAPQVSRFWFGEAWRYIREHPATASRVTLQKAALFWNDFEIPDSTDQYLAARYSWVMRLPLLGFGCLLPWAVVGAATAWRDRSGRLLLAFAATYAVTAIAFFIMARYRIQVLAAVLPLAACGAGSMVAWLRAGAWQPFCAGGIALAATALATFHSVDVFAVDSEPLVQQRLHHLGVVYAQAGDDARALAAHLEGARTCQRYCRFALEDLATFYATTGRREEGMAWFRRFLAERPGHPVAEECLAKLSALPGP